MKGSDGEAINRNYTPIISDRVYIISELDLHRSPDKDLQNWCPHAIIRKDTIAQHFVHAKKNWQASLLGPREICNKVCLPLKLVPK